MKRTLLVMALLAGSLAPQAALAQSRTTIGVGSGAVAGALVGGPIGAVAGAVIGGVVGSASERGGRRQVRRRRRSAAIRRPAQRRAEAQIVRAEPAHVPAGPAAGVPAEPVPTAWKNPH